MAKKRQKKGARKVVLLVGQPSQRILKPGLNAIHRKPVP
jgi:hypothetical protein